MDWPFDLPPIFLLAMFAAVVVALVLINSIVRTRRMGITDVRCNACGETHPPFARFCRRCGNRL